MIARSDWNQTMESGVVKVCPLDQSDKNVDFLGVARRRDRPSGYAERTVPAVDPAGRPKEIAQRLRRQRFVAEFPDGPPQAERLRERPAALQLRFGQGDRLKAGDRRFAALAILHARPRPMRAQARG
jgi:hypothetical protein